MSFVWLGIAVLILPTPGGKSPEWLRALMTLKPAYVPLPIIAAVAIALIVHFGLMRSSFGVVLRGAGGNPKSVRRAGWSLLRIKMTMFALPAFSACCPACALSVDHIGRRQHRTTVHTLVDCRRDTRRRRVHGRPRFADRRRHWRDHAGTRRVVPVLPAAQSRLADRRPGAILIIVLALRAIINRGAGKTS